MIKTVVGSFDTFSEAAAAARDLRGAGFLDSDVNVIANNTRAIGRDDKDIEEKTSGTATGIVAGGALGGAAGLAASLMGLAIPGIGPILAAGPIAAALAGAGAGAVAGGLIGGLTDLGVNETHAEFYAEAVRRGAALVTVRADESRADDAEQIIRRHGAFDIEERVLQWKSAGWKGYDPRSEPFTFEEIERDRTMWHAAPKGPAAEIGRMENT